MPINPYLTQLLETCEPACLQSLAAWLEPELGALPEEGLPSRASQTDAIARTKEVFSMHQPLPPQTELQTETIQVADLVAFSLLHEFGAAFAGKPCFQWLSRCVSSQFGPPEQPISA